MPGGESYQVVLHNDDEHGFDFVEKVLAEELKIPIEEAQALVREIDARGRIAYRVADLAAAESLRDRILARGPDPALAYSKASLIVAIEKLEGSGATVVARSRRTRASVEHLDDKALRKAQWQAAVAMAAARHGRPGWHGFAAR